MPVTLDKIKSALTKTECNKIYTLFNSPLAEDIVSEPMKNQVRCVTSPEVIMHVVNVEQSVLIDSGSVTSCISQKFNDELKTSLPTEKVRLDHIKTREEITSAVNEIATLHNTQKVDVKNLLQKHSELFSNRPNSTNVYEPKIELAGSTAFVQNTYPITFVHQGTIREQIHHRLEGGVIKKNIPYETGGTTEVDHPQQNVNNHGDSLHCFSPVVYRKQTKTHGHLRCNMRQGS